MPKLPILKPREIIKIFYHPKSKKRAVVPYHLKDLPLGTLSSILNESGISKEEFIKA